MKRGGSLKRRAPLQAKTALVGSTPLSRSSRLTRTAIARWRPQRSLEEVHARRVVTARALGRCEGCGAVGPTEWSHRISRGRGGPWCATNGLALCTRCHSHAHAHPDEAYALGWFVHTGHVPAHTPVHLAGRGWSLLGPAGEITATERSAAA